MNEELNSLEVPVEEIEQSFEISYLQDLCTSPETLTLLEFSACSEYLNASMFAGYMSLFCGVIIGFLFSKGLVDGWKS